MSLVLNEIPPGQAPRVSGRAWLSETSGLNQKFEMCNAILGLLGEDKGWRLSYSPMAVTIPTQRNFHKKSAKTGSAADASLTPGTHHRRREPTPEAVI